jgi:hypothetical protein
MQLNQTTLFLYNGNTINYPSKRCSVQTKARILEAKGYSVVVCLYPNNAIQTLTDDERPFEVVIRYALLIIHPPPSLATEPAEPAEVESNGRSTTASSLQGDSDGATLKKSARIYSTYL